MSDNSTVSIFPFDAIEWTAPPSDTGASEAMRRNVDRKLLAQGEGGYFAQHIRMPPGHIVEPHSHSADELVYILAGELEIVGGPVLRPNDSAVIGAGSSYGFTVGREGVQFLLIRPDAARTTTANPA